MKTVGNARNDRTIVAKDWGEDKGEFDIHTTV
jgi:hypothetical protein